MSPDELQAIAYDVAKISAFCGAVGALAVLVMLALFRQFTDWFLEREQRHQRIAAARARAHGISDRISLEYLP